MEVVRLRRAGPARCLIVMPSALATGSHPLLPRPRKHKGVSVILGPSCTIDATSVKGSSVTTFSQVYLLFTTVSKSNFFQSNELFRKVSTLVPL